MKFTDIVNKLFEADEQLDLNLPRREEVQETLLELNDQEYALADLINILKSAELKFAVAYKNLQVQCTSYEYGEYAGLYIVGNRPETDDEYAERLDRESRKRKSELQAQQKKAEKAAARKAAKAQGSLNLNTSK